MANRKPERKLDGYVYFLQGEVTKLIKIGFTTHSIKDRTNDLQTGSPDKLVPLRAVLGRRELEQRLHQRFAQHRVHGEWFHPHADVMYFVEHYVPSDPEWQELTRGAV
jgi:hypothetical protein